MAGQSAFGNGIHSVSVEAVKRPRAAAIELPVIKTLEFHLVAVSSLGGIGYGEFRRKPRTVMDPRTAAVTFMPFSSGASCHSPQPDIKNMPQKRRTGATKQVGENRAIENLHRKSVLPH